MPPLAPMLAGVPNCVRCWCLAACLALQVIALRSRAEDVLDVPADCGSRAELERGVAELTGPDGAARAARPPVALQREGEEYVLHVQLENGRRSLRDRDCRALFRAAVLIAALGREALMSLEKDAGAGARTAAAIAAATAPGTGTNAGAAPEAGAAAEGAAGAHVKRGPEKPATVSAAEPATAAGPAARAETAAAARSRDLQLGAFLSAALAYGVVPDFTLALAAGAYLERGWLGARLGGGYQLPQSHHEGDQGVRSDALSVSATLELLATRWLKAGVGGDFYVMHARGLGVPAARTDWATLATLHAGLGARLYGRRRWALEAQARGVFAPQPARFEIRGGDAVYATSRFGFQLGLAWGWRFL